MQFASARPGNRLAEVTVSPWGSRYLVRGGLRAPAGRNPWPLVCGVWQAASCKVEFISLDGRTIGVQTLESSQLRKVSASAVPHERLRAAA